MSMIITPSHTCGPLFGFAILPEGLARSTEASDPDAIFLSGEIRDEKGHLGLEAFVEIFSPGQAVRVRTHGGRYEALVRRPAAQCLADGRPEAAHLTILIHARGLVRHLMTRAYLADADLAQDPVAGLVAPGLHPALRLRPGRDARHFTFDITLRGEGESVFFDF